MKKLRIASCIDLHRSACGLNANGGSLEGRTRQAVPVSPLLWRRRIRRLPMLARSDDIATTTANWLSQFEHALAEGDEILLKALFHPDSHWRDVLALTWRITTINGGNTIASELCKHDYLRPSGFKLAPGRTAPRHVIRAGVDSIEAIFVLKRRKAAVAGY